MQERENVSQLTSSQWDILKKIERDHGLGWIEKYETTFKRKPR